MTTSNNSVDFNLSTEDVLELFKGVSITDQLVFTLNGLSSDPERTAFLSRPVFETHPNLLASIIRKQPALFQFITEYAKDEWQFIDAYIEGSLLKDTSSDNIKVKFSPTFKASLVSASSWIRYRDLAQKVLSVDGYALHSMPPTIQQDRELVMTAMTSSPGSLSALPVRFGTLPSFRNDKEMIMFALSQDKGDAEFVWKAITLSAQGEPNLNSAVQEALDRVNLLGIPQQNIDELYAHADDGKHSKTPRKSLDNLKIP